MSRLNFLCFITFYLFILRSSCVGGRFLDLHLYGFERLRIQMSNGSIMTPFDGPEGKNFSERFRCIPTFYKFALSY